MTLSSPSRHGLVAALLMLTAYSQSASAAVIKRGDNSTPAERKRIIGIVVGTVVGFFLIGGLILLYILHRRIQRRDLKEAEGDASMELEGDIDDSDYPSMPRPSKQREGQAPVNPFEPPRDRPYDNGDMK
ncbi:hypothetical protein ACHAQA_008924 [Verticillium albo-atrum]